MARHRMVAAAFEQFLLVEGGVDSRDRNRIEDLTLCRDQLDGLIEALQMEVAEAEEVEKAKAPAKKK